MAPAGSTSSGAGTAQPPQLTLTDFSIQPAAVPVEEAPATSGTPPASADDTDLEPVSAPGASERATEASSSITASSSSRKSSGKGGMPLLLLAALPAAAGAAYWLTKRLRKGAVAGQHKQQEEEVEPEPTLDLMTSLVQLQGNQSPVPAFPNLPLAGQTFVVSEAFDVAGETTGAGIPAAAGAAEAAPELPAAGSTAPVIRRLLEAGASLVGKAAQQPLCSTSSIGDNIRNPGGRMRVAGGGCTGSAVAVAAGRCQFALGTDYLGSVRVPAACTGVMSFTATHGSVPPQTSMSGSGSGSGAATCVAGTSAGCGALDSLGVVAPSTAALQQVAEALGVPGSSNLKGELMRFVVAEDLFGFCSTEMAPAVLALKRAVIEWAGPEQAGSVQLAKFFGSSMQHWRKLLDVPDPLDSSSNSSSGAEEPASSSAADGSPSSSTSVLKGLPDVLVAMRRAALILQLADLQQRYGSWAAEALPQEAAAQLAAAAALQPEHVDLAKQVAREVSETIRNTIKSDTVVVVPVMPSAAPCLELPAARREQFVQLSQCFAALVSLGGCPCVAVPAGVLPDGTPLSVAMFMIARTDARLLAVVHKLHPMMMQQAAKIEEDARQNAAAGQAAGAAKPGSKKAAAGKAAAGKAGGSSGSRASVGGKRSAAAGAAGKAGAGAGAAGAAGAGAGKSAAAAAAAVDPKQAEKAEKLKAKGNEHFSAGRYAKAFEEYSKAVAAHPGVGVYYSNRAMAGLKIYRFEQAEQDCCKALELAASERDRVKALLRRGTARQMLHKYEEAIKDYKLVIALEPNNRQAREELRSTQQMLADAQEAQERQMQEMQAAAAAAAAGGRGGPADAGGLGALAGMLPGGIAGMGGVPGMSGMPGMEGMGGGEDEGLYGGGMPGVAGMAGMPGMPGMGGMGGMGGGQMPMIDPNDPNFARVMAQLMAAQQGGM